MASAQVNGISQMGYLMLRSRLVCCAMTLQGYHDRARRHSRDTLRLSRIQTPATGTPIEWRARSQLRRQTDCLRICWRRLAARVNVEAWSCESSDTYADAACGPPSVVAASDNLNSKASIPYRGSGNMRGTHDGRHSISNITPNIRFAALGALIPGFASRDLSSTRLPGRRRAGPWRSIW